MKSIITFITVFAMSIVSYSQNWSTTGNPITDPNTQYFGTTSAQDLIFKTNSTEAMRIMATNGNVGIGTDAPANKLHVAGGTGSGVRLENMTSAVSLGTNANGDIIANNFAVHAVGDVKYAMLGSDHSGWYKMDGLTYANHGLSATAIANANSLSLGGNLPNATDRYLSQVTAGALGSTSGSNSVTLTQVNLPNITVSGATNSTGSHTHYAAVFTQVDNNTLDLATESISSQNTNASLGYIMTGTLSTPNVGITSSSGAHSHTFTTSSINGNVTPTAVNITPATLKANAFIYLGS